MICQLGSSLVPHEKMLVNSCQLRQLRCHRALRLWPFAKLQHGKWPTSRWTISKRRKRWKTRKMRPNMWDIMGYWIDIVECSVSTSINHPNLRSLKKKHSWSTVDSQMTWPILTSFSATWHRPLGWAQTCHRSPRLQSADRRLPLCHVGPDGNNWRSSQIWGTAGETRAVSRLGKELGNSKGKAYQTWNWTIDTLSFQMLSYLSFSPPWGHSENTTSSTSTR